MPEIEETARSAFTYLEEQQQNAAVRFLTIFIGLHMEVLSKQTEFDELPPDSLQLKQSFFRRKTDMTSSGQNTSPHSISEPHKIKKNMQVGRSH